MCWYSSLAETINSLLVFTQQPLLPPLDIFGSFCDQDTGRKMSDRGRMSIKSRGSPPTLPYSNTLNASSTNMWTSEDCFVFLLLHDCFAWFIFIVCCRIVCVSWSFVYTVCDQQDVTITWYLPRRLHAEASHLKSKNMQTLQINNRYLEKTLVLTYVSSRNVAVVIHMPQGSFEGWVVQ